MSPITEEDKAREDIDNLLSEAGWQLFDVVNANIMAGRGVAIREFPLPGHGFADYLLYVDGKAAGVIEAKKAGVSLSGVETHSEKYTKGLPEGLPHWSNPLPFSYRSTGVETRFTNGLDPQPRARPVFAFHRPETLAELLDVGRIKEQGDESANRVADATPQYRLDQGTFLARLQHMPPLKQEGLWPAQITAINNLEKSLRENRPRALIQMATGSGKTYTAVTQVYRLAKFVKIKRALFLVDRGNLATNAKDEFEQFIIPQRWPQIHPTLQRQHPRPRRHPRRHQGHHLHHPASVFTTHRASDKANLDLFWLGDESLEDTENLPPPEVLAQEIVEQLVAALEEFRSVEEVLATNNA